MRAVREELAQKNIDCGEVRIKWLTQSYINLYKKDKVIQTYIRKTKLYKPI